MTIPTEERRRLTDRVLATVESHARDFTSAPPDAPGQFTAAALMRCCALLRGLAALEGASLGALMGILERQLWETWLVGMHAVLRGDEGLTAVAADDIHYKRVLAKKLDLGLTYHDDWEGDVGKLNYKQLADDLGPLLEAVGEDGEAQGATTYDLIYRVQSLFAAHANLSTIGAYLKYEGDRWSVEPNPPAPFGAPGLASALCTLHLASYVFRRFELPMADLQHLWDDLLVAASGSEESDRPM